jgi:hypothetical protein
LKVAQKEPTARELEEQQKLDQAKAWAKKNGRNLSLGMKCRECLHFQRGPKSPLYKDRCVNLGRKSYSAACKGFEPDFTRLNKASNGLDSAVRISRMATTLDESQIKILVFSLLRQSVLNKLGYRFGQLVYIYLSPAIGLSRAALNELEGYDLDYAENYYKAYVTGAQHIEGKEYQVCFASSVAGKPDYWLSLVAGKKTIHEILLSEREWEKRRQELKDEHKLSMPKKLRLLLNKVQEWKHQEIEGRVIDETNPDWWYGEEKVKGKTDKGKKYEIKFVKSKKKKKKKVLRSESSWKDLRNRILSRGTNTSKKSKIREIKIG